jgi:hypothetical protein
MQLDSLDNEAKKYGEGDENLEKIKRNKLALVKDFEE